MVELDHPYPTIYVIPEIWDNFRKRVIFRPKKDADAKSENNRDGSLNNGYKYSIVL